MRNCLPRMYEALARSELWGADIMAVGDPMRRVRVFVVGCSVRARVDAATAATALTQHTHTHTPLKHTHTKNYSSGTPRCATARCAWSRTLGAACRCRRTATRTAACW